jgi:uncharacterized protein
MPTTLQKYALIVYLAKSHERFGDLGKKALQKLAHLSSEITNAPLGYKFELYTYGPFSRDLASDVDTLESMGIVDVNFDEERNGYKILPTDASKKLLESQQDFIDANSQLIDSVVNFFGGRLAKDLELSSMLTYIIKNRLVSDIDDDKSVVDKFLEIKPHYSRSNVSSGLSEIRRVLHDFGN